MTASVELRFEYAAIYGRRDPHPEFEGLIRKLLASLESAEAREARLREVMATTYKWLEIFADRVKGQSPPSCCDWYVYPEELGAQAGYLHAALSAEGGGR